MLRRDDTLQEKAASPSGFAYFSNIIITKLSEVDCPTFLGNFGSSDRFCGSWSCCHGNPILFGIGWWNLSGVSVQRGDSDSHLPADC